jgi:hypothetical protein
VTIFTTQIILQEQHGSDRDRDRDSGSGSDSGSSALPEVISQNEQHIRSLATRRVQRQRRGAQDQRETETEVEAECHWQLPLQLLLQ